MSAIKLTFHSERHTNDASELEKLECQLAAIMREIAFYLLELYQLWKTRCAIMSNVFNKRLCSRRWNFFINTHRREPFEEFKWCVPSEIQQPQGREFESAALLCRNLKYLRALAIRLCTLGGLMALFRIDKEILQMVQSGWLNYANCQQSLPIPEQPHVTSGLEQLYLL